MTICSEKAQLLLSLIVKTIFFCKESILIYIIFEFSWTSCIYRNLMYIFLEISKMLKPSDSFWNRWRYILRDVDFIYIYVQSQDNNISLHWRKLLTLCESFHMFYIRIHTYRRYLCPSFENQKNKQMLLLSVITMNSDL